MHNIKDIRKNLDFYKKKIAQRNSDINFDVLIKLDGQNRELIQHKEKKEQEKKLLSKSKDPSKFELSKKLTSEIDTFLISQNKLHTEIFNIYLIYQLSLMKKCLFERMKNQINWFIRMEILGNLISQLNPMWLLEKLIIKLTLKIHLNFLVRVL